MENKEVTIKLNDKDWTLLINFIFNNLRKNDNDVHTVLRKILNQRSDQLFPRVKSPWNDYVTKVNYKVIELDNDKEAQRNYIIKSYYKMLQTPGFDSRIIDAWFKSQMLITGNNSETTNYITDFLSLYIHPHNLQKINIEELLKEGFKYNKENNEKEIHPTSN